MINNYAELSQQFNFFNLTRAKSSIQPSCSSSIDLLRIIKTILILKRPKILSAKPIVGDVITQHLV